jgi:hypothetical protein
MTESIEDVVEFINDKLPENMGKILSLEEMKKILDIMIDERHQYFTENSIHHREWPDDDEYNIILDHIDCVETNLHLKKKQD